VLIASILIRIWNRWEIKIWAWRIKLSTWSQDNMWCGYKRMVWMVRIDPLCRSYLWSLTLFSCIWFHGFGCKTYGRLSDKPRRVSASSRRHSTSIGRVFSRERC
jgi:hypothetical protein